MTVLLSPPIRKTIRRYVDELYARLHRSLFTSGFRKCDTLRPLDGLVEAMRGAKGVLHGELQSLYRELGRGCVYL
jgi:hypothetical protein